MPRIQFVSAELEEQYDSETDPARRLTIANAGVLGHQPEIAAAITHLTAIAKHRCGLPPRLLELIRLRIAFHNQCRSCMAMRFREALDDGVTDELVCSLERPAEAEDLTAAERAALHYADLFATDHLQIDDAVYDSLRKHFTEKEIVAIAVNCAVDVGMGRMMASFLFIEDLPDTLQGPPRKSRDYVPWGTQGLVFDPLVEGTLLDR